MESLPENDVPKDLMTVKLNEQMDENAPDINTDEVGPDLGSSAHAEDTVYDEQSSMSSFLPVASTQSRESKAAQEQMTKTMDWPSIGNNPFSEFTTPYLASMAFQVLFPDGKGDPANP